MAYDATTDDLLGQALGHQQSGRASVAETLYRQVLRRDPRHPAANFNLGVLALQAGNLETALFHLKTALEADPSVPQAWYVYVDALLRSGRRPSAREVLLLGKRRGLAGKELQLFEARVAATAPIRESAACGPFNDGPTSGEMTEIRGLFDAQRFDDACARAIELTRCRAHHAFGWKILGMCLRAMGRGDEALVPLTRSVELDTRDTEARLELAFALEDSGCLADAEAALRVVLQIEPANAAAYNSLGVVLDRYGRNDEAEASLREALRIQPDFAEANSNLGLLLQRMGRLSEAEDCFKRALEGQPPLYGVLTNLGRLYQSMGWMDKALSCYQKALQFDPDLIEAHSNVLYAHCFMSDRSVEQSVEAARRYGQTVRAAASARFESWPRAQSRERLRVGFVSGDLRNHPVGYFLESLLVALAASRLELFAYPTQPMVDALTSRIRPRFSVWKPLYGRSDEQAARLIRDDGINVLIDLSGHTAHNRLPVFAWKPAPVQVSWLGYFATTGVAEIDYFLADAVSVPSEHRGHFTETVWYLPDTRLCFTPPAPDVPVTPLPALSKGYVTLGNFQNLAKIGDEVVCRWGQTMAKLPDAHLRLQNKQLGDPRVREQLSRRLRKVGIAEDRVNLHGPMPRREYLAAHSEVDFIVDTFPFPGGTTTCEAIWMGVPTLTIAGDRMIARQGASLLSAVGLDDWIAHDGNEYVDKAVAFARALPALSNLRASLRRVSQSSPLFDAPRFAANFEDAVRQVWARHCVGRAG